MKQSLFTGHHTYDYWPFIIQASEKRGWIVNAI